MFLTFLTLALALQAGEPEPVVVTGRAWAPFISPMGEPFRSRSAEDDTMARWFQQTDQNGDSVLAEAEMGADALRFFKTLDADGNGLVLPEEMVAYEWEVAPEVQVNSRWRDARGTSAAEKRAGRRSGYEPDGLQGAARYALLNMPQPVAAADSNFDRAVTVGEFKVAAAQRFQLLDTNSDSRLDLAELRTLLPLPRHLQKRRKTDPKAPDARIANPVPVAR